MNGILFWFWGPGLLAIAAAVALYAQHRERRADRERHTPAE
jgi:hypothetical protein